LLNRKISSSLAEISKCALSELRNGFRANEDICKVQTVNEIDDAVHKNEQRECKERKT